MGAYKELVKDGISLYVDLGAWQETFFVKVGIVLGLVGGNEGIQEADTLGNVPLLKNRASSEAKPVSYDIIDALQQLVSFIDSGSGSHLLLGLFKMPSLFHHRVDSLKLSRATLQHSYELLGAIKLVLDPLLLIQLAHKTSVHDE